MSVARAVAARHELLIPGGPGTVAHVWWDGVRVRDTRGNAWAMQGTVPQVAASGRVPAGAGPFSDANYYSLGTGSDVLDFAGDFSACFVYRHVVSAEDLFGNGGAGATAGYDVTLNGATAFLQVPGVNVVLGTGLILATLNVTCFGRSGANIVGKNNLGSYSSTVQAMTPGTTYAARLGLRNPNQNTPLGGALHEVWFSTMTPSDALFAAIQQRVKARVGITAW